MRKREKSKAKCLCIGCSCAILGLLLTIFTVRSDRYRLLDRRSLSIFNPIERVVRLLITGRYKSLERNKRFYIFM